jgi:hypothetical protein
MRMLVKTRGSVERGSFRTKASQLFGTSWLAISMLCREVSNEIEKQRNAKSNRNILLVEYLVGSRDDAVDDGDILESYRSPIVIGKQSAPKAGKGGQDPSLTTPTPLIHLPSFQYNNFRYPSSIFVSISFLVELCLCKLLASWTPRNRCPHK